MARPEDEARERAARRDLDRAGAESEALGSLGFSRVAKRAADHLLAREAEAAGDPIELWGRRVGRALSVVATVVLAWYVGTLLRLW